MRPARVVVCLVTYIIRLCCGQMFDMDLIEPPEDPETESGMAYDLKVFMADYPYGNTNLNENGYRAINNDDEPDLSDLDQTLTKLEKWEDFEQIAEDIEKRNRGKKKVNMEQDARDLSKWLKDLKEGHAQKEALRSDILSHPFVNRQKKYGKPSPGMSMYWPEDAMEKEEPVFPNQETANKKAEAKIPIADVMKMAKLKMREAMAKRAKTPSPQKQLPKAPKRRMSFDVDPADDGIGPHAPPQKEPRRPQKHRGPHKEALPPKGDTDPKPFPNQDQHSQMGVNPSDDAIGPHAQPQKGSRLQEEALPSEGDTDLMPFRGQKDYSPMGVDPNDDGIGPHAFRQKRSPMPRPQDYGESMPFPNQEDYSQMGGDGQGDFSEMGGTSQISAPQRGGIPKMGSRGRMTQLQKAAFPQKPLSAFQQGGLFPMSGGGHMSAPQKGRLPPMSAPPQEAYPQMGSNGPMGYLQGTPQQRFPQMGGGSVMQVPQMGGGGPMSAPPRGPYSQMGNNGPMGYHQGASPQEGGDTVLDILQQRASQSKNPMLTAQRGGFPQMGGGGPVGVADDIPNPYTDSNSPQLVREEEYEPGANMIPPPKYANYDAMNYNSPHPGPGTNQKAFPPRGAIPQIRGNAPMPFPPQGAMSQNGGDGPMPFPQQRGISQNGGNGPMSLFPQGTKPQMGGNGHMRFPQQGARPQMGGNGPMPFPQQGAMPQMSGNGPKSEPHQEPKKDMDYYYSIDSTDSLSPGVFEPRATPEPYRMLPDKDDFNTPIKWVPMSSAKVEDGIAKVTDMDTGSNFNVVINGSIFLPIIDDSFVAMIEPPTTAATLVPRTTTENIAMKALLQFVTPEELTRNDWLGFDAALSNREKADKECDGGGCRARCHTQSCQSRCHGDTCSAGCIGIGCKSSCDGPGCLSMCIGDNCKASCNGQACDARCKGSECTTDCKSFSCTHTANGAVKSGGGAWGQHYPEQGGRQYPDGPRGPGPKGSELREGPMYEEDYSMKSEFD